MKEVNEANAVLSDPEKRAAYDQLGKRLPARPGIPSAAGLGCRLRVLRPRVLAGRGGRFSATSSPSCSAAWGGGGRLSCRRPRAHFRARGEDHHAKVLLDLEDAFTGATRQISLRAPRLDAQGRVHARDAHAQREDSPGVHAGQIIRLAGQGAPGMGGAPAGDLLLEVQFRPHPRFRAEGRDLHLTLPVAPWEAALGAVVAVDLPRRRVKVRIPEGAQSGRQLRVRGKGIPGEPPGDLLLDIQVVLPPADTPRARALYETMAQELAFDPRRKGGPEPCETMTS